MEAPPRLSNISTDLRRTYRILLLDGENLAFGRHFHFTDLATLVLTADLVGVLAYEAAGLFIVLRQPGRVSLAPRTAVVLRLVEHGGRPGVPRTVKLDEAGGRYRMLAEMFNSLLDRLAAYHTQIIRFTADASHELRSPLGAMRAAVEITLQKPRGPEEYRTVLASLGEQCERLTALVNGLLLLAQANAGEVFIKRNAVDLAALAGDVGEMFEPVAEEKGIQLVTDTSIPVTVAGDWSRLRQLVTNLLDNAIRFTERGGTVIVRVARNAENAMLLVSDPGISILEEHLNHIFERFYQADAARSSAGYGLGLSICRWNVRAHGGPIEAANGPVRGAEFTVSFPLKGEFEPAVVIPRDLGVVPQRDRANTG